MPCAYLNGHEKTKSSLCSQFSRLPDSSCCSRMTNEEQITNGSRMDHRTVANCELSKQMTIERWQLCGISSYLLASAIRKQLRNVQLLELPFDSNDPRSFFLQTPRSSAEDHLLLPCIINQSKSQSRHLTLCCADEIDLNGRGDPKKVLRPT